MGIFEFSHVRQWNSRWEFQVFSRQTVKFPMGISSFLTSDRSHRSPLDDLNIPGKICMIYSSCCRVGAVRFAWSIDRCCTCSQLWIIYTSMQILHSISSRQVQDLLLIISRFTRLSKRLSMSSRLSRLSRSWSVRGVEAFSVVIFMGHCGGGLVDDEVLTCCREEFDLFFWRRLPQEKT